MFGNNGNNSGSHDDPASPDRLNRIVEGSTVEGDLVCESNLRIDGRVKGTIRTESRLVIGENGHVEGEVTCKDGEVEGTVQGSITASELISLKSTSHIEGDIRTKKLAIEEGANFTGNCTMGASESKSSSKPRTHAGTGSEEEGTEDQERPG